MNKKKTKKTNSLQPKLFLYIIFLATVIPTIYVYAEHAKVELNASIETKSETKKVKTSAEALFFAVIALGYGIATIIIIVYPQNRAAYFAILVGTVFIIFVYWFRIYGLQIPFTNIFITDFSSDWRDVITKICQNIMLIPVSMLLILNTTKSRYSTIPD